MRMLGRRQQRNYFRVHLLLTLSLLLLLASRMSSEAKQMTHYEQLEIEQTATPKDIKKAYRRLAVKHHPDRNIGREEEATVKFRAINEAYEILSDESSRRQYDQSLKYGDSRRSYFDPTSFGNAGGGQQRWEQRRHERHRFRDPFEQFNTVFKNDPFFADAFREMDDLFDKHFSNTNNGNRHNSNAESSGGLGGWLWNTAKKFLPEMNIEVSTSTTINGQTSHSSTSYGKRNQRNTGGSSYTSRSTRTIVQNGRRVTIQSLEKDGNKIEERYVGDKLIERTINGRKEVIGRIGAGGEF
mmetsp:Transcript_4320/g.9920  ORF Transcript_4320/g.9920 Transcript_4320/m.9920 type:complete len:298 (+) Transcript_4320:215-1108(+)